MIPTLYYINKKKFLHTKWGWAWHSQKINNNNIIINVNK